MSTNLAVLPKNIKLSPPIEHLAAALHARGPRPFGEVLLAALRRLPADDRAAVLDLAEGIAAWPIEVLRAHGGDRFARPALGCVGAKG